MSTEPFGPLPGAQDPERTSEPWPRGPIWVLLPGHCGVIVVSHKQQPKCVAHRSVDQSIEETEQYQIDWRGNRVRLRRTFIDGKTAERLKTRKSNPRSLWLPCSLRSSRSGRGQPCRLRPIRSTWVFGGWKRLKLIRPPTGSDQNRPDWLSSSPALRPNRQLLAMPSRTELIHCVA